MENVVQSRLAGAAVVRPGLAGLVHSGSLLPTVLAVGAKPHENLFFAFLRILINRALHSCVEC